MSTGYQLNQGCELGKIMSRLGYFLLMPPPKQPPRMVRLTNDKLSENRKVLMSSRDLVFLWGLYFIKSILIITQVIFMEY